MLDFYTHAHYCRLFRLAKTIKFNWNYYCFQRNNFVSNATILPTKCSVSDYWSCFR
jgi:hypothetical protein